MDQFSLFFLGFSSLFPLINPIGTALVIDAYFSGLPMNERKKYSLQITLSCFVLGLGALFLGSWVLKFMGISIAATQIGGGIVIAKMGLELLQSKSSNTQSERLQQPIGNSLFYPLAFPLTLGPGSVSTLIALSAHAHQDSLFVTFSNMGVLTGALFVVCVLTYFCFSYSHLILVRIGSNGSLIINRLLAFLVFCIGIQMLVIGLKKIFL